MKRKLAVLLPLIATLASCGTTVVVTSSSSAASSSAAASSAAASSSAVASSAASSAAASSEIASSEAVSSEAASSSETSSSAVAQGPFITEPTEITLWSITGQNNQKQLQNYVDGFMAAEPNVKVNNIIQTGMDYNELKDAVNKGFAANNYPDIVQCYPDHVAEYINYGKAVNLDPYIDNADYGWTAEDKADYIKPFVEEGKGYTITGTYSVPYCKSTELMFYNASVLIGLNLSAQDATINEGKPLTQAYFNSITWEELLGKLCPAIVAYNATLDDAHKILKTDQDYHSVFAYDSDDNLFITLAQQYGYGYTSVDTATGNGSVDFNNDGMKQLLKTFSAAKKNGYMLSKGSAKNNYTNTYFTKQNTLFSVGSTGGVKYQFSDAFDVGVGRIPHAAGQDPYVINQGPSLTVLDHGDANRKLASWLFYKYMTNKANTLDWALNSGYMGIRNSNYTDPSYVEANDPATKDPKTLEKLMATANTFTQKVTGEMYTSPAFLGSSTCRTQAAGLMVWALTNDLSTMSDADINTQFQKAVDACKLAM